MANDKRFISPSDEWLTDATTGAIVGVLNKVASATPETLFGAATATVSTLVKPAGPLTSYMGQVATRCGFWNYTKYSGFFQAQGRTIHQAADNLTAPRPVFSTAKMDGSTPLDVTATIECSIEYPLNSGNYHRRLYSGVNVGTILTTAPLIADASVPLNGGITIPKGAFFAVRSLVTAPTTSGLIGNSAFSIPLGAPYYDGAIWSTNTAQTSLVMTTGTGGGSGNNDGYNAPTPVLRPVAILDNTTEPSAFLAGDSITAGFNEAADGYGRQGMVERALGNVGSINAGLSAESCNGVLANAAQYAVRASMIPYCSHIIMQYGINDVYIANLTGAQTITNLNTYRTTYGIGKYMLACTLIPQTTSTDSWVTTANQTVGTKEAGRIAYNNLLRGNALVGYVGVIDFEAIAVDNYNVPKWKAAINGNAVTADGIHPSAFGYNYIGQNMNIKLL